MFCECVDYGQKRPERLRYWIHKTETIKEETGKVVYSSNLGMNHYIDICPSCDREIDYEEDEGTKD